jgi:hypothetical protein
MPDPQNEILEACAACKACPEEMVPFVSSNGHPLRYCKHNGVLLTCTHRVETWTPIQRKYTLREVLSIKPPNPPQKSIPYGKPRSRIVTINDV